jgi:hypothetical protein
MQTVSEKWKNAHGQTLLNESFVEIAIDVGDPYAHADVTSEDNGAVYLSHSPEVKVRDKSVSPFCTLEQNMWVLDGKRKAIPIPHYDEGGYIGDSLSDDVCVFSSKMPIITLTFSEVFTKLIPGITITWSTAYEEFADTFVVVAYNGDTVVAEKEVIGNRSIRSVVEVDIVNYDRIVIFIKKWCLPHHRARMDEIFVGINRVYSKANLFNYTHSQSVDSVSVSLPKTEIKFSIDNVSGEYNPYNHEGWSKYLMERQEVRAKYGLKLNDGSIEWIKGGSFYLSEWYAKQNGLTADFTARDILEFMSATYDEEIIELSSRNLYDIAKDVLYAANLPDNEDGSVKWHIDDSLKECETTAPLPRDTIANCLLLIANAGQCVMYQDREGILRIERISSTDRDYSISAFNSYSKPEVSLIKPIKQVNVKVYSYTMNDGKVSSTTRNKTLDVGATGETITIDNPLITDENQAASLANWMVNTNLINRMTLDFAWRPDVRLDALDVITNESAYGTNRVLMTDVEYKYNGAFRGTGKGRVI